MRKKFCSIFKSVFSNHLRRARYELNQTQSKMADQLVMDARSYRELESGKSSCSGITLALYLLYCCPDPQTFLDDLRTAFESDSYIEKYLKLIKIK